MATTKEKIENILSDVKQSELNLKSMCEEDDYLNDHYSTALRLLSEARSEFELNLESGVY